MGLTSCSDEAHSGDVAVSKNDFSDQSQWVKSKDLFGRKTWYGMGFSFNRSLFFNSMEQIYNMQRKH